jgi:hypothetical protein
MATIFEQVKETKAPVWECKDCHEQVAEQDTVAYHLVNRILYGWCARCFGGRENSRNLAELAA